MYEPGTNWSYAHTNFVRLGEALTAITGEPRRAYPSASSSLGMRGTQSYQTAVIPEPVLHAYTKRAWHLRGEHLLESVVTLAKGR